jgi:hypothetical protein
MKQCTKCKVEKELDQFQKYWHSTQQKERIRGECTECLYKQRNERKRLKQKETELIQVSIRTEIIQPVVPELEIEVSIDYSDNPDYKQCIKCKEYKTKDKFYKDGRDSRFNRCKICIKKKDDADREKELIENGGSLLISPKPNTYKDKYQKELVFQFLPLCGWIFNEEKQIWWKPGLKDENGKFFNLKPKKRKTPPRLNIKRKPKYNNEEIIEMKRLKDNGESLKSIADKFNCTLPTIYKYIRYETEG